MNFQAKLLSSEIKRKLLSCGTCCIYILLAGHLFHGGEHIDKCVAVSVCFLMS